MVKIYSVFTVLGLVLGNQEWMVPTKLDVKGAFMQMPMKSPKELIKMDAILMKYMGEIYPEYDEYQGADGSFFRAPWKEKYRCVQAS
jgi:hypothetical protein